MWKKGKALNIIEQPHLVEDVPAHSGGVELDDLLMTNPNHSMIL